MPKTKYNESVGGPMFNTEILKNIYDDKKVIGKDKVRRTRIKEYYFVGDHLIDINEKYPFDEFNVIPSNGKQSLKAHMVFHYLEGLQYHKRLLT